MGDLFAFFASEFFIKKQRSPSLTKMTPVTSSHLKNHPPPLASEQPKEEKVLSLHREEEEEEEEEEKGKDKDAGEDDGIDYDRENVSCSSPRTRALDHFIETTGSYSPQINRKICDSLVSSSEEEEDKEELKDTKEKEKEKMVKYVLEKAETVGVVHRDVERRRGERFVTGNAENLALFWQERPDENLLQDDGKRDEIDFTSRPGD